MVANNAAGTRTVRYRASSDNVLALELVPKGDIIRTCSRSVKQPAGYALTYLFTGSEGRLGLITEVTPKQHPLLEDLSVALATFNLTMLDFDTSRPSVRQALGPLYEVLNEFKIAKLILVLKKERIPKI